MDPNSSELGTSEIDPRSPDPPRPASPNRPFEEDEDLGEIDEGMENLLDARGEVDEGEGDELFGDGLENDYRAIDELDDYRADLGNYHIYRYIDRILFDLFLFENFNHFNFNRW